MYHRCVLGNPSAGFAKNTCECSTHKHRGLCIRTVHDIWKLISLVLNDTYMECYLNRDTRNSITVSKRVVPHRTCLNDVTHLFLSLPASPIRCIPRTPNRRTWWSIPSSLTQDGKHQRNQDVHIPIGEMDVVATFPSWWNLSKLMQPSQADFNHT